MARNDRKFIYNGNSDLLALSGGGHSLNVCSPEKGQGWGKPSVIINKSYSGLL